MRFIAAKCNIMRVSRTRDPKLFNYSPTGQVLEEVMDAKYLGVTLSNDLKAAQKLKQAAYFSLVRPFMEYFDRLAIQLASMDSRFF